MKALAVIEAGICGFETKVAATSDDDRTVSFDVQTECEKVAGFANALKHSGRIDAYQEISPAGKSVVLETARNALKGCCAACVVPVGLFKCMQVAAGLALPKEIQIRLSKE
jgi:hypothetical protein